MNRATSRLSTVMSGSLYGVMIRSFCFVPSSFRFHVEVRGRGSP